jgi:mannose-1-phosphate guanylyltransferase
MPADHVIAPASKFRAAIDSAARVLAAREDAVVTIGIRPDHPATAYGYIQRGERLAAGAGPDVAARLAKLAHAPHRVLRFREKPNRATAEEFLAAGDFFWNAGIFVWRAKALLAALERELPETAAAVRLEGAALAERYPRVKKISIDFAVLERHPEVVMIEADFQWSDVGSWSALAGIHGTDAEGNTIVGARHAGLDSRGLVVVGDGERLVATVGLEDVVVVETKDALLICKKDRVEDVKKLVEKLEREGRADLL